MRRLTRYQTAMLYRASGPDETSPVPTDQRRRDLCERRIHEHQVALEARRRTQQLEITVDHLMAQLEETRGELQRLRQVHQLSIGETIRLNLARDLPGLRAKHPDGVLLNHLVEHFGFDKAIIRLTTTAMAREGLVEWVPIKGRREMALQFPGEDLPVPVMITRSRRRALDLLRRHAEGGLVRKSVVAMAAQEGLHPSTLNYDVSCLIRDRRLFLVERGVGRRPSIYAFEPTGAPPVPFSPSVERRIGDGPRYPRRKVTAVPVPSPPAVIREKPVVRIRDDMAIEMRREPNATPARTVTSRLMGDPTSPRWESATLPKAHEEPLDRDGLRLQREIAALMGLD